MSDSSRHRSRRRRRSTSAPLIVTTAQKDSDDVLYATFNIHAALYALGSGEVLARSNANSERTFAAILQQALLKQTPEMDVMAVGDFIGAMYELVQCGLVTAQGVVNFPTELL